MTSRPLYLYLLLEDPEYNIMLIEVIYRPTWERPVVSRRQVYKYNTCIYQVEDDKVFTYYYY